MYLQEGGLREKNPSHIFNQLFMHPCPPCSSVNPPVAATVVSVEPPAAGNVVAVASSVPPAVIGPTVVSVEPPAGVAGVEAPPTVATGAAPGATAAASVAPPAGAGIGRAKDLFFLFFPPFLFFVSFFSFCFLRGCTLDRV